MRLAVKIIPKSSRNELVEWIGQHLKVCVTAAPERGKANAALEALLAKALGVPRAWVRVVAGQTGSRKIVEIDGVTEADVGRRLAVSRDAKRP